VFELCCCYVFAEKVFAGGVPKCAAENCSGVVKPGEHSACNVGARL